MEVNGLKLIEVNRGFAEGVPESRVRMNIRIIIGFLRVMSG